VPLIFKKLQRQTNKQRIPKAEDHRPAVNALQHVVDDVAHAALALAAVAAAVAVAVAVALVAAAVAPAAAAAAAVSP
jgi:hypothetical protein